MLWVLLISLFVAVASNQVYVLVDCDLTLSASCRAACREVCPERVVEYPRGIDCVEQIPEECVIQAWIWTVTAPFSITNTSSVESHHYFVPAHPPATFKSAIDVIRYGTSVIFSSPCELKRLTALTSWDRSNVTATSIGAVDLMPIWSQLVPDSLPDWFHTFQAFAERHPHINTPDTDWQVVTLLSIIFDLQLHFTTPLNCYYDNNDQAEEEPESTAAPTTTTAAPTTTTSLMVDTQPPSESTSPSTVHTPHDTVTTTLTSLMVDTQPPPSESTSSSTALMLHTPYKTKQQHTSPPLRQPPHPIKHERALFERLLKGRYLAEDRRLLLELEEHTEQTVATGHQTAGVTGDPTAEVSGYRTAEVSGRQTAEVSGRQTEEEEVDSGVLDLGDSEIESESAGPVSPPNFVSSLHLVRMQGLEPSVEVESPPGPINGPSWVYIGEDSEFPIHPSAKLRVNCDRTQSCCQAVCRSYCTVDSDISCLNKLPADCVVEVVMSQETSLEPNEWCRAPDRLVVEGASLATRASSVMGLRGWSTSNDSNVLVAVDDESVRVPSPRPTFRPVAVAVDYFRLYFEGDGIAFEECGLLPQADMGIEVYPWRDVECTKLLAMSTDRLDDVRLHYQASARRSYLDYGVLFHSRQIDMWPREDWALYFVPRAPAWCPLEVTPTYVASSVRLKYATKSSALDEADCEEFADLDSTHDVFLPDAQDEDGASSTLLRRGYLSSTILTALAVVIFERLSNN